MKNEKQQNILKKGSWFYKKNNWNKFCREQEEKTSMYHC